MSARALTGSRPGGAGRGEHAAGAAVLWRLRGYGWTIDAEIEKFFENVVHELLTSRLSRAVGCPQTIKMIRFWMAHFSPGGAGSPQGSPVSPVLANFHLGGFDRALEGMEARLIRCVDDSRVLARRKAEAERALARIQTQLAEVGLRLNPEKTRLAAPGSCIRFLGLEMRGAAIRRVSR